MLQTFKRMSRLSGYADSRAGRATRRQFLREENALVMTTSRASGQEISPAKGTLSLT